MSDYFQFESADGLSFIEVTVRGADPPWPAMVSIEPSDLSSLLVDDVTRLAGILLAAATRASQLNEQAFSGGVV